MTKYECPPQPPNVEKVKDAHGITWVYVYIAPGYCKKWTDADYDGEFPIYFDWGQLLERHGPVEAADSVYPVKLTGHQLEVLEYVIDRTFRDDNILFPNDYNDLMTALKEAKDDR